MERYIKKNGKKLRLGYTTGSCAAAAAKAATWMLLTGIPKEQVTILTPKGIQLSLDVLQISIEPNRVSCAIEKDSGDDPDITKNTLIFACVSYMDSTDIVIDGGEGVGRVTRHGLDQPVGAAAINSVPRQMIREQVTEVCQFMDYHGGLSVVISVPGGEALAKKTFNPRLGITGGISILGTTGIVEPMSEQALVDTIKVELRQRKANGAECVLLTPGNYGLDYIQKELNVNPAIAVLTSNFIGESLDYCRMLGFQGVLLVGHIGKLVKIAGGMLNTHSKYGDCRMEIMAAHAGVVGVSAEQIAELLKCVTCDDAIRVLLKTGYCNETLGRIMERMDFVLNQRVFGELQTGAILFSKEYGCLGESKQARKLLHRIVAETKWIE